MLTNNHKLHWLLASWVLFFCVVKVATAHQLVVQQHVVHLGEVIVIGRPPLVKAPLVASASVYYPTGDPTCDGTFTVEGSIKHLSWCALSPDLRRRGGWRMGDTLLVNGNLPAKLKGLYVLHDFTNASLQNRVALLVPDGTRSGLWNNVRVRRFTIKEL